MLNHTLFVKLNISCLQYKRSFFRVQIGKFYTWLIFFCTTSSCDGCDKYQVWLRPEPPSAHQHKFNSARSTTKSVTNCDTKNSLQKKRRKIILACLVFWFWYCCVAPKARYLLHLLCTKVNICMKSMLVPTAQSWHKNLIEDFFTICANFNNHLKNTPNHNKFHSWSFESTRLSSPSLTSFVSTASSSTSTSSLRNSHIYSFSIFCNL